MRTKIEGAACAPPPKQQPDAAALRTLLERVAQLAAALSALVARILEPERRHGGGVHGRPLPAATSESSAPPSPSPSPTTPLPPDGPRQRLTPREREVLDLVSEGLSSKEIARSLGIARATARCHIQSVLTKLGVGSRAHAVALAQRAVAAPPVASRRLSSLTRRETEVLHALASGLGQREVAARLYLSPHTVRTHVQRLLVKLGVHSVLGALAVVRRAGPPAEAPARSIGLSTPAAPSG